MRYALAILIGTLLPALAGAQAINPSQVCERTRQSCVRACTGPDAQACFLNCASNHAQCLQNPHAVTRKKGR